MNNRWPYMFYYGDQYKVIEDVNMIVASDPYEIEIPWMQRWFSLPWQPFKMTKIMTDIESSREVIIDDRRMTLIMHPSLASELREKISEKTS